MMHTAARSILFGAAAVLLGGALLPHAWAAPQRIVSLNPCLDVILVNVADRDQIAALSHFSRDRTTSTIADLAETLPITYETAEEVIALKPDLVMTSQHSSIATQNALRRLGVRTELFDVPQTIADSYAQIRAVSAAVGQAARGDALVSRIEQALAAAAPPPGTQPVSALVFQRNGFVSGKGTLVDEMLTRTGFTNVADDFGWGKWGYASLEQIIAAPPAVLLAGEVQPNTPTWADRVLSHPALERLSHRIVRARFPDKLLYCSGPVLVQTAAALADARALAQGHLQ